MSSTAPSPSIRDLLSSLMWPVFVPGATTATVQTAVMVLLPLYVLELGYDASIAALILGTRGIGQLIGDIPAAMVAGRWGDKASLLCGTTGYCVGYGIIAVVTDPMLLAVGGFIAGFGMSFSLIGRQAYVTQRAAPHQRGRAISLMAGAMRVGALLGPLIGGLVASAIGYQNSFIGLVILCLLSLLIVLFGAESGQAESDHSSHSPRAIVEVISEYRHTFMTAGLAMISLQFMRAGRVTLLPLAGAAIGLDVASIGFIVAAAAAVDTLLFMPSGIVMDKNGRKPVAVASLLIFAIGLALVGWADSYATLLAAALLVGFANGISAGLVMVLGSDHAPEKGRARFLGVWKLVSDVGNAAAPIAIGGLLGITTLLVGTQLVALTGVAGLAMVSRMKETLQRPHAGQS
ncbi:MFS transporter [Parathalassolituus penaei]|uniref:MFS transporter n=1 Tax=Parathalassolituus penaei TaxID=2997323 RepID=A0A9X3ISQ1_9GAMM|nr:MFS transporter [Parathalassolituus penaei]MCY0966066.1 MFS transporter [Parathalassolituus penaei]